MISQLAQGGTFWMPQQASSYASDVDNLFYFIYYVSLFFFVLIVGLMFMFILLYRRRSEDQVVSKASHNTPLEITWTILPSILLVVMFWWGFKAYMVMRTTPENAYEIKVNAQKWSWEFVHPNGVSDSDLYIPLDTPIKLVMFSQDVLHSCFIPAFRAKRDVVPGRYADLSFTPTKVGEFPLLCAEYCGTSHSDMRATVHVRDKDGFLEYLKTADPFYEMTVEEFDEYLKGPEAFIEKNAEDPRFKRLRVPLEMGQELYTKKGCKQCHSLDGAAGTGPTWKGLYGEPVTFRDGSRIERVDDDYLRESMLDPHKRIVQGFEAVMPKTTLSDPQISVLISYIKSLKEH